MIPPQHELPDRIAGTLINRADLLLALAKHPPEAREAVAAACGFAHRTLHEQEKSAPAVVSGHMPPIVVRDDDKPSAPAELRFLQAVAYQSKEVPDSVQDAPPEIGNRPISEARLDAQPYRVRPEVLQPWSRLWPWLHYVLGQFLPGRRIDLARLIDDMASLRPVQRLPFRRRLAWAPQLHILVDGVSAMDQFRDDIDGLLARLRQMRGSEGFQCRLLCSGPLVMLGPDEDKREKLAPNISPGHTPWTNPGRADTVLVLGDLGCFQQDARRMGDWLRYGLHLRRNGVFRIALSPCPRDRWDSQLASVWACSPWDRHERSPHGRSGLRPAAARIDQTQRQQMLESLLRACSVPLLIESALLREMRLLLPDADAGLEQDLRAHPEVSAMAGVCALNLQHVDRRMAELAVEDEELLKRLKERLPELLARHHRVHGALLRASETYNLRAAGLEVTEQDFAEAQSVFRASNRLRLDEVESTSEQQPATDPMGLAAWNSRELARQSRARTANDRELASACALEALASGGPAEPPDGIDHEAYQRTWLWMLGKHKTAGLWLLRQHGQTLTLKPCSDHPTSGTPLGLVPAQTPSVSLRFREKMRRRIVHLRTNREDGRSCDMETPRRIFVVSDRCELQLAAVPPPAWATRFGWDRFGLFADLSVGGVTFPLRWIPPGEFKMGSPEEETGRWSAEGPQHRVTIGRGFWLGATPVTQAQYAAVTGERPSEFEHAGDQAPVEQVSWEDCQKFCGALPEKVTDFDAELTFRLPSEAEWEYACRAGTTTALYNGEQLTSEDGACPNLDQLAWYNENAQRTTHSVGQKTPNHWGLYDMLGNVWEWCEDTWHGNYKDAPDDGSVWGGKGGYRVYRGGGWGDYARGCRCACRSGWEPGYRGGDLGFRLVLAASVNRDSRPFS